MCMGGGVEYDLVNVFHHYLYSIQFKIQISLYYRINKVYTSIILPRTRANVDNLPYL
jgi:hypothetical protein